MAIKVLHIIDSLGAGGAELLLEMTLPKAGEAGLDVRLVYLNRDEARLPGLAEAGIPALCLREKFHALKRSFLDTRRDHSRIDSFLDGWKPHIIHGHLFSSYIFAPKVARHYGVPYVLTEHSLGDPWQIDQGLSARISRYLICRSYNSAAAVVCVSNSAKQYLVDTMGITRDNAVVIDNCISDIFWEPVPNIQGRIYDVIICGRLAEPKNHLFSLEVLSKLRRQVPSLQAVIVGEGAMRRAIEDRIQELNLSSSVKLAGFASLQRVVEYLDSSRVLLMPSNREGFGLALVEGLARSLPAVISDISGFSYIDCDGMTKLPLQDADSYVNELKGYLDNRKLYCRQDLRDRFSISRHNHSLHRLYDQILTISAS